MAEIRQNVRFCTHNDDKTKAIAIPRIFSENSQAKIMNIICFLPPGTTEKQSHQILILNIN